MHTFSGPEGTVFHSNSDLSGDVAIHPRDSLGRCDIPGADLIAFVANYVRNESIAWLEQAEDKEVLGL